MPSDNANSATSTPSKKKWVYAILAIFVIAALAYFALVNKKDRSLNHDYYRVLYEASNSFNENLIKLNRMHQSRESIASIRSLLPSYTRKLTENSEQNGFEYTLVGQSLLVKSPQFTAQLAFEDILPVPKKGFSQYLFADQNGQVLATIGSERTISIVDMSSINQEIQRKNKQFQLNISDPKQLSSSTDPTKLPSYSNHVDMKISYGDFRVYVFPFSLSTPLDQESGQSNDEVERSINKLYLVGLLPQHQLTTKGSGHWNISVLVVTLVSLVFMWSMLRLYLLPKNQSITKGYRAFTVTSSYLFYIVIISLALAYFQKTLLQYDKDHAALVYAENLSSEISQDLNDVFHQLSQYRDFYSDFLAAMKVLQDLESDEPMSEVTINDFNAKLGQAIATYSQRQCVNNRPDSFLPGSASTSLATYTINYVCDPATSNIVSASIDLDEQALRILTTAFVENKADLDIFDFYSVEQSTKLVPTISLESMVTIPRQSNNPNKMLSVFALNSEGNSVLPSIFYQESNSLPATFNLSHRDYYKKVRDHKGWDLVINTDNNTSTVYQNVFIQRLLNVNNGTRGTTISMPIREPSSASNKAQQEQTEPPLSYIIGADVLLPSLTLGEAPPFDFTYMVVERSSGDVLFHNDTGRSLVENVYFSGDADSSLSKWLKAGLDQYPEFGRSLIDGSYHGEDGRFAVAKSPINDWVVVVFFPDDSLHAFMTNQFMYISMTFGIILIAMVLAIYAVRYFVWTGALKKKLDLPAKLNVRLVMLVSSILFSASYSLYIIGHNIDLMLSDHNWSLWLPLIGLLLATLIVYRGCYNHFCHPMVPLNNATRTNASKGSKRLIMAVLVAVSIHFVYLQNTAHAPLNNLKFHYAQLACNWMNYERQELISIGLSRYPNTITALRTDPVKLLPLDQQWQERMNMEQRRCKEHSTNINPDDYPNSSSLFGVMHLSKWVSNYLLKLHPQEKHLDDSPQDVVFSFYTLLIYSVLLVLIIWLWFRFNTRTLWNRLYCPERFLQHIDRITKSVRTLHIEERTDNLKIECDTIKLNGIGLALLLRAMSLNGNKLDDSHLPPILPGFDELYRMSPCLQKFSADNRFLPNLKLNIKQNSATGKFNVEIWDIETSLEKSEFRQLLLDLIMELKSLTLSRRIENFTIFAGFHSLQRVKMKDPLQLDQSALLDHAEYLSWAECLMDFIVIVPESFKQGIDWNMVEAELANFPELKFLSNQSDCVAEDDSWQQVWKREDDDNLESRWLTINYILLNAEALYRFKWESCSSAEKLALLNLAKGQRLNPTNTQMIEHLALNGLITVRKGHLDIVNRSFAHFVLNAETAETLNRLVRHGEAGIWKSYRLPLGILILLIIGGIALTSGESIYIIAASMAGILGTIASVTNSANLLRGQSKD